MDTYNGYIGTYTKDNSKGIYKFSLDINTGLISNINLASEIENPTYLTINKENKKLYSVMKYTDENNNLCGGVASFNINEDLSLTYLNSLSSIGKSPCYVSLDTINNTLFSGNYHEKNIISYSLNETGKINNILSKITHDGNSHVHFSSLTPDKKYLCVVDLGLDEVILYDYNEGFLGNKLTLKVKTGSGPRHLVFHPNGQFAYVICEYSSEVIILSYDSILGFTILNYISTIPENYKDTNYPAAIVISSDGKFLYGSNRGHNSIVTYLISNNGCCLTLVDYYSSYGVGPRDFTLTPNEEFIIISNEISNNITTYRRDKFTGALLLVEKDTATPSPVSIAFL